MSTRPVLVIEHERDAPAGLLAGWLEHHGADVHLLRARHARSWPERAQGYELIVALGSECSAAEPGPAWVERELALLRGALAADTPVLGICFGCQLLARAAGGAVSVAREAEIGWMPVQSADAALVAEGPWLQWHFDTFALPAGVRAIATSEAGPQAFTTGRSLGVQFHPEADEAIVRGWVRSGARELERGCVDGSALIAQTHANVPAARAAAWSLFEAYRMRVARIWD